MDNTEKVDYGENSLNELFETLDSKTKEEILRHEKQKQIEILKDIQNPELKNFWNKMSEKEKEKLDALKVRVKYTVLKTKYAEFLEVKRKINKLKNTEKQPDVLVQDNINNEEAAVSGNSSEVDEVNFRFKTLNLHENEKVSALDDSNSIHSLHSSDYDYEKKNPKKRLKLYDENESLLDC